MRRIWRIFPAALALSAFAIGDGFSAARAQSLEARDAAMIMNGLGSMFQGFGTGLGNARYGTNGVPMFVGGNYNQPGPWGGNQWPQQNPYQQQVIYQPPPMYAPPMYQPPVYAPPMYQPPVYAPPMYQPPPQYYQQPAPPQYYQQPAPPQQRNVIYNSGYNGYAPPVQYVTGW